MSSPNPMTNLGEMSGINKVILVGHLGKPPDVRVLGNNSTVLTFPFVTNEKIPKGDEITEHNEWHNVIMWNALAEKAKDVLEKGMLIHIEGSIKTRRYIDKNRFKRYVSEIAASSFTRLSM